MNRDRKKDTDPDFRERTGTRCFHCGEECGPDGVALGEKRFCCPGCRTVYELLEERNLCAYYSVERKSPGHVPKDTVYTRRYEFLDDESVAAQLIDFHDGGVAVATFNIPGMHCSSCIWLLERLHSFNTGIVKSTVHFPRKEVTITFLPDSMSLREIVVLLASIGYEPLINLQSVAEKRRTTGDRKLYYKIGVAGFAFGNIMLLSFPEYLASGESLDPVFRILFRYANLLLALPVFLYSSLEFFRPAWTGLRRRKLTIDVPIVLGIIMLFSRSAYEIVTHTGPGYLDSMTGLVFLLLIGRIFQKKSFDALSFDRDFRSYFPLWVTVKEKNRETSIPLTKLCVGDRIVIRNQELIPADSVLIGGEARIDYSFVTGESELIPKRSGDLLFAGGRQSGQAIEMEVVKEISQGYLTRLWNDDVFTKPARVRLPVFVDSVSAWFTLAVVVIAATAFGTWWPIDPSTATTVFTAVLIVACPCALALSSPFALGTVQRILARNSFFVKNTETVEALARVDTIVFDKTGTLTRSDVPGVRYEGDPLTPSEEEMIKSLARHSTHTLSRRMYHFLPGEGDLPVRGYDEIPGKGVQALIDDAHVRIGSHRWTGADVSTVSNDPSYSSVSVSIDGRLKGIFSFENVYRKGIREWIGRLGARLRFVVLSGDTNREEPILREMFGDATAMYFGQSPMDKMRYIQQLKGEQKYVLMVGDGLNDSGALKAADVGISVSDDINTFSPACDAILSADRFHHFERFLHFAKTGMRIVYVSFVISILYNLVGLSFAVTGMLSPLVSAILMPVSSVSVVAFTTVAARLRARTIGLR